MTPTGTGYQNEGEEGLAGIRVVTGRGPGRRLPINTAAITSPVRPITPNESRGSNFVLKLDDRTLPTGLPGLHSARAGASAPPAVRP